MSVMVQPVIVLTRVTYCEQSQSRIRQENQNLITSWRLYEDYVSWCKINSQPAEEVSLGEAWLICRLGGRIMWRGTSHGRW